jgi:hypothetical protein
MVAYATECNETGDDVTFVNWHFPVVDKGRIRSLPPIDKTFQRASISYLAIPVRKPSWINA